MSRRQVEFAAILLHSPALASLGHPMTKLDEQPEEEGWLEGLREFGPDPCLRGAVVAAQAAHSTIKAPDSRVSRALDVVESCAAQRSQPQRSIYANAHRAARELTGPDREASLSVVLALAGASADPRSVNRCTNAIAAMKRASRVLGVRTLRRILCRHLVPLLLTGSLELLTATACCTKSGRSSAGLSTSGRLASLSSDPMWRDLRDFASSPGNWQGGPLLCASAHFDHYRDYRFLQTLWECIWRSTCLYGPFLDSKLEVLEEAVPWPPEDQMNWEGLLLNSTRYGAYQDQEGRFIPVRPFVFAVPPDHPIPSVELCFAVPFRVTQQWDVASVGQKTSQSPQSAICGRLAQLIRDVQLPEACLVREVYDETWSRPALEASAELPADSIVVRYGYPCTEGFPVGEDFLAVP